MYFFLQSGAGTLKFYLHISFIVTDRNSSQTSVNKYNRKDIKALPFSPKRFQIPLCLSFEFIECFSNLLTNKGSLILFCTSTFVPWILWMTRNGWAAINRNHEANRSRHLNAARTTEWYLSYLNNRENETLYSYDCRKTIYIVAEMRISPHLKWNSKHSKPCLNVKSRKKC